MFWKLFGSERRVQEALEQSVGYDISPNVLHMAANSDIPPAPETGSAQLGLWRDYAFTLPDDAWERKKA